MPFIIRKSGILTTIQDLGRPGARSVGINPGGVMDTAAARIVNIILGNEESAAVIEMHFPGALIEFEADAHFAIGGADLDAQLDEALIPNWSSAHARKGQTLRFARKIRGNRAYLGVQGGILVEEWLGSKSTNLTAAVGGFSGRPLAPGDRVEYGAHESSHSLAAGQSLLPRYNRFPTVRVVAGSEFDLLNAESEQRFLREGFTLTGDCNRMGFRLVGKPLYLVQELEMVSSPVSFGTIQLLPDGQMIVLMADHQTSGGYPRIANVISADLPLLAQCGTGDGVGFTLVSIEEAENASLHFERELNYLRVGCRLQRHNANR